MTTLRLSTRQSRVALSSALLCLLLAMPAVAQYQPADLGQRPAGSTARLLPEQFLRGYDPVTLSYGSDQVNEKANADDGAARLKIVPAWPGAYVWVDRRTLQFRPAEPWPALARFQFQAQGVSKTLTTMMSAPAFFRLSTTAVKSCWSKAGACMRSRITPAPPSGTPAVWRLISR